MHAYAYIFSDAAPAPLLRPAPTHPPAASVLALARAHTCTHLSAGGPIPPRTHTHRVLMRLRHAHTRLQSPVHLQHALALARAHAHTAQAGRGGTCAHPGFRAHDSDYPSRFEADAKLRLTRTGVCIRYPPADLLQPTYYNL